MKRPIHLRKVTDNRLFAYTEALAQRADMVPIYAPGEAPDPEPLAQQGGGLELNPEDNNKLKQLLHERETLILKQEKQITLLGDENAKLYDKIDALERQLAGEDVEAAETVTTEPPGDKLSSDERLEVLVKTTREMIEADDPNDFTGSGVPRVEVLESYSGIAEITASERDEAYKIAKEG